MLPPTVRTLRSRLTGLREQVKYRMDVIARYADSLVADLDDRHCALAAGRNRHCGPGVGVLRLTLQRVNNGCAQGQASRPV